MNIRLMRPVGLPSANNDSRSLSRGAASQVLDSKPEIIPVAHAYERKTMKSLTLTGRNISKRNVVSLCSSLCLFLFVQSATAQDGPRRFDRDGSPIEAKEEKKEEKIEQEQPSQPIVQDTAIAGAMQTAASGPGAGDTKIKDAIQEILDYQDRFGQNPANNPLLADLQDALNRHSAANVLVINHGPGNLVLEQPDGTTVTLEPSWGDQFNVSDGRIVFYAERAYVDISLEHSANSGCRFWDGDDNRHTELNPSTARAHATLGRGLQHYWLEK